MTETDLKNISEELYKLSFHIHHKIFNPALIHKGSPIPPSNTRVLFHLVNMGPCSVSKIANDLTISRPNMTPIIDNLISTGYVNRFNSPDDRRIIMVEPAQKAFDFLKEKKEMMTDLLSKKLEFLESSDLDELNSLLPQVFNIISKLE